MLPFLKLKQEGSASLPADSIKREPDEEPEYDALESAAEDLCNAIKADDYKAAAAALRAAIQLAEPSEQGEEI